MMLIDRNKAVSQGLPRYFTGKPCKKGHLAERFVANYTCCVCADNAFKKWYADNPDAHLEHINRWRDNHPDTVKKTRKKWSSLNPEKARQSSKQWKQAHPSKINEMSSRRRADQDDRSPDWLNSAHRLEFESIYKYCSALRAAGLDYHVDHIVPLRGKSVSGLHVPWNLQVIPAVENMRKGNRFI